MVSLRRPSLFLVSAACLVVASQAMAQASSFDRERGIGVAAPQPATVPTSSQGKAAAAAPTSSPSSFDRERGVGSPATITPSRVVNPNALGTVGAPPAVESSGQ